MEKISLEQLNSLLERDHCFIKLKNLSGFEICINPKMYICFDENANEIKYSGYELIIGEKELEFEDVSSLLGYLKEQEVIIDDKVTLLSINDNFPTVLTYEEDKAFNLLDMKGLLEKYEDADEFEVVVPYGDGYSAKMPYGTIALSKEDAEVAISGLERQTLKSLRVSYDNLTKEDKRLLPEFDKFVGSVKLEIERELKGEIKNLFMCDRVAKGKTKFKEPMQFVWRAYLELEELLKRKLEVVKMQDGKNVRELTFELDGVFRDIKNSFISVTPTYSWHCTTTSMLYKLYRFKLNDVSKKWLMQFEDDYHIEGFEDLAFYKGDKLLFSSCTHEGFHTDLSK